MKKQPFAARPFAAKATSDTPSSFGRSRSQHTMYFSQTDPHLARFFRRKSLSASSVSSPVPSRPATLSRRGSLSAGGEQLQTVYRVALKTGEGREHGTRAKVFITLCGTKAKLSKRLVPVGNTEEGSALRPGNVHKFSLTGRDIGDLKEIIMENSGLKKEEGWFLAHVSITKRSTGERWGCLCRQWLSLFHSDCQTTRVLPAKPFTAVDSPSGNADYKLFVHTADVRGAGTDANVFVTLVGTKGDSPVTCIGNRFSRGSTECHNISCQDLGRLLSVRLGHDDSGFSSAWLPTKIEMNNSLGQNVIFPCGQWLAREMGDGETERILTPQTSDNKESNTERAYQQQCRYVVTTHTGKMKGAGTDSQVFLTMVGSNEHSRQHLLDNSTDNFTRGRVDKFLIEDNDVGELKSLRINLVKSGLSSDWFLEYISVQEWGSEAKTIMFHCDRWLLADKTETKIEQRRVVELFIRADQQSRPQLDDHPPELDSSRDDKTSLTESKTTCLWLLKVVTTDIIGAGTDAKVFIQLHVTGPSEGSKEEEFTTERLWLEDRPEYFERGQVDEFSLQLPNNIGSNVTALTVGHDNNNPYPEWHLDHIELSSEELGIGYTFSCGKWLSAPAGEKKGKEVVCRLTPEAVRKWSSQHLSTSSSADASQSSSHQEASTISHQNDSTTAGIPYSIHVTLTEKPQSTSKGHLVVSLIGCHCVSPPLHLLPLSKPDLLPSKTEVYSVHTPDVGSVDSIRLWLESSEKDEKWCIEEVAIHCPSTNMVYNFASGNGEGSSVGVGKATTLLLTQPTPSSTVISQTSPSTAAQLTAYEVQFLTADKKMAGTKGTVHLILVGENKECSKVFHFTNNHGQRFQRGQTDTFQVAIDESKIGPIAAAKVAHSSLLETETTGKASSWYLYKISLTRLHDRHRISFMVGQWIPAVHSDQINYTVTRIDSS